MHIKKIAHSSSQSHCRPSIPHLTLPSPSPIRCGSPTWVDVPLARELGPPSAGRSSAARDLVAQAMYPTFKASPAETIALNITPVRSESTWRRTRDRDTARMRLSAWFIGMRVSCFWGKYIPPRGVRILSPPKPSWTKIKIDPSLPTKTQSRPLEFFASHEWPIIFHFGY